ncbi:MAG TPA: hypothetical protein DCS28_03005 [Candidatus Moranbacteria bacterium]|nr:hypothetical protein [Candidatus Moranbacteria bacterium]HAT74981.1 hypothetical protein [Candidatus Moranbacteria bacterium]
MNFTKNKHIIVVGLFVGIFSVFFLAFPARADYYSTGSALSTNLLNGLSDVAQITGFTATATIPTNTGIGVQFSQDQDNWHDHNGVEGGWDALSAGVTNIDLTALEWTTANLYYRVKFTTTDPAATATLSEAQVNYSDIYTPYVPPWSGEYQTEGNIVSTDLLSGASTKFNGSERFGYNISSLPSGTTVSAQFSQDGTNFYNSSGTLWGWDSLSAGVHLDDTNSLDLSVLNWTGAESFYYKLKLTTTDADETPVISEAGLLQRSVVTNSPNLPGGSAVTMQMSLTDKMTNGLVGVWSFDGPDINWSTNTAYDRSGQNNNGTISGATAVMGKRGQALSFNGTTDYVNCGNVGTGIQTVSFWIKTDDATTRKIINIDGTDQIEIDGASNILATGFPSVTIYVDGTVSPVVDTGWHFIAITDATGVSASVFQIGQVSASFFDGIIDEVRVYNRALSADEVGDLYRLGQVKFAR